MNQAANTSVASATRPDPVLEAVRTGVSVWDLGRPLRIGMPQSPNHPAYWHALPRRHGDMVRADGGSAANDIISMGTHVGTHIDALAHVSQDGRLFDGSDAREASTGGHFDKLGVHTIAPMVRPGILLDVPGALGVEACAPGAEITREDLLTTLNRQAVRIARGDVVLIRSGWGKRFTSSDAVDYVGRETGVPGIGADGAGFLADLGVHAVGADTIAFERLAPDAGHALLPVHRIFLVENGIYIVEAMELEALARDRVYEFTFILSPLPLYGATGSPVRPLAVRAHG